MDWNISIPIGTIGGLMMFGVCSKADFEFMDARKFKGCGATLGKYCAEPERFGALPEFERERIGGKYAETIGEIIEELGKVLRVPESVLMHDPDMPENKLPCRSVGEKLVYEHTGIDFLRQKDMNYLEWLQYCADAAKYNLSGSAEGVIMLNSAYDEMFVPFDRDDFFGRK